MSWAVSLQAVFAWFIGYLRYALRRRDQGTGADPHPEMDYSESFIEKDIPSTEDGQEPDFVSDEMTEPSQKNPLGLLYSICVDNGKTDRWFYSAKRFPGLSDYMAENEDEESFSLFEMMFELEGHSRKGVAMKFMDKKDFDHAEDFINLERDFIIHWQYKPDLRINAPGVISAFRHLIKYDPYQSMAGNQMVLFWGTSWNYPSWYHKELVRLQRSLSRRGSTGYLASDLAKDSNHDDTANQIG